jgi:protein-L-isoaspartate(D-aspartate) O-methyltransferase
MMDFRAARQIMVDGQVRPSDVHDLRLIGAMLDIPREAFVAKDLAALAYADCDLPLDGALGAPGSASRWLIKPMVLARLLNALGLGPEHRLLVVGAGTGYSAAVASRLAGAVIALEEDAKLAERARGLLSEFGFGAVAVVQGPLTAGWPASGPYDAVVVDGGVELVPQALLRQLTETGRLAAVVVSGMLGKAMLCEAEGGEASSWPLFDAMAPVLPGFRKAPKFVF